MKFKKVIIYYFSGTGNAKNTALWVSDEAEKKGVEVEIFACVIIQEHRNCLIVIYSIYLPGFLFC